MLSSSSSALELSKPRTTFSVAVYSLVSVVSLVSVFGLLLLPAGATVFPWIQGPYLLGGGVEEARGEGYAALANRSSLASLSLRSGGGLPGAAGGAGGKSITSRSSSRRTRGPLFWSSSTLSLSCSSAGVLPFISPAPQAKHASPSDSYRNSLSAFSRLVTSRAKYPVSLCVTLNDKSYSLIQGSLVTRMWCARHTLNTCASWRSLL